MDCVNPDNYFLDCTLPVDSHTTLGGEPQYARSDFKRLIVDAGMTEQLNMAVVIEYFGQSITNIPDAPYSWVEMNRWEPVESLEAEAATGSNKVVKANITQYASYLEACKSDKSCFGTNAAKYYEMLVEIDRIMLAFSPSELTEEQRTAWESWLGHCDDYNDHKEFINNQNESIEKLTQFLSGI